MHLEGSCHCKAVRFTVTSRHPCPFMNCYCAICRKTGGSAGFGINLAADFPTLVVTGQANIRVYRAGIADAATGEAAESQAGRSFCGTCGSALWLWDPRWPDLVHPHAGAIDSALPVPPDHWHIMLASKASWVVPDIRPGDRSFDGYPDGSIAAWHEARGLVS